MLYTFVAEVCSWLYYIGLCKYTFSQRRNRLTTRFSERIPVVKLRIFVMLYSLEFIFCVRDGLNVTVMYFPYVRRQASLKRVSKRGSFCSCP